MKLLIIAAFIAVAAASQTYNEKEVPSYGYGRRDYGYGYDRRFNGYGYDRKDDYAYGRRDYGYGYDRRDYGYGYDKKADYSHDVKPVYNEKDHYAPEVKPVYNKKSDYGYEKKSYGIKYYGKYPGKCGNDGLYFRDEKSFVFCSNGNSYVQPCAPGTRNSPYQKYSHGATYSYRDFCDVNLVDEGYAAKHAAH